VTGLGHRGSSSGWSEIAAKISGESRVDRALGEVDAVDDT